MPQSVCVDGFQVGEIWSNSRHKFGILPHSACDDESKFKKKIEGSNLEFCHNLLAIDDEIQVWETEVIQGTNLLGILPQFGCDDDFQVSIENWRLKLGFVPQSCSVHESQVWESEVIQGSKFLEFCHILFAMMNPTFKIELEGLKLGFHCRQQDRRHLGSWSHERNFPR